MQVRGSRPLAQARTGPGVGPVGGAFFDEDVDFHMVFEGVCVALWATQNCLFSLWFDDFDGNCAKVHADSEDYCESLDMWSTSMKLG